MSRIIYTTCGTSLFTSNCWQGISDYNSIFQSQSPDREDYERIFRQFTTQEMHNDLSGQSLATKFDINVWNDTSQITKLTAELASLKAIIKFYDNRNAPLNRDDKIILIHSGNVEGKFCAQVIQTILREKIEIDWSVERKEFEGLDPQNAERFNRALMDIWTFCRNFIQDNREDTHLFNLTGGYKGTAIILGGLIYKEHTSSNIVMFYLHETSNYQNIAVNGYIDSDFATGYIEVGTGEYHPTVGGILNL